MNTAKEHYDRHLASIYSWMTGSTDATIERNRALFHQLELDTVPRGLAVDLGAGSGFQSIPLAELGFSVIAVDFCSELLSELRDRSGSLSLRTVHDDILHFSSHIDSSAQVIVYMGDTLTHLESVDAVKSLLLDVGRALAENGRVVLTFRDYVSVELHGTERFIPVRSDESQILTCFLEYHERVVEVHDLLYRKEGEQWLLSVSSYPKLRLDRNWVCKQLGEIGLTVLCNEFVNGMICIVAKKSSTSSQLDG